MSRQLLVNILVLVCLPIVTATVAEQVVRNWRWPIQFRLSTAFWAVSAVAVVMAALRTEQILYAGRGGGPIASLDPWGKVPVLFGCLCTLYGTVVIIRGLAARLVASPKKCVTWK